MQYTENYKLNLIETDDTFNADALNENAKTLDAQLARVERGQLVYVTGQYIGSGTKTSKRLDFDFKPLLVVVTDSANVGFGGFPWIRDQVYATGYVFNSVSSMVTLTWEEKAVVWRGLSAERNMDREGTVYHYLAIGIAE